MTTLAQKLQVKPGEKVFVVGDATLVGELPEGALQTDDEATADVAVYFVESREQLDARFRSILPETRVVWLCYRKGEGDVNRTTIMDDSGDHGWRPISNVAVDDLWSAIRVRPLAEGEARAR